MKRGILFPVLMLAVLLLPGCRSPERAPRPAPANGKTATTGGNAATKGGGFEILVPTGTEGFFQELLIFFGADRPPSLALNKIRETHNLKDWSYRPEEEDAVQITRDAVLELSESDYTSWDETALVITVLSTLATRDPSSLVRADCITSLSWFRGWIHEDAVGMGEGVTTSEEEVIKALKALDALGKDPRAGGDPAKTLVLIDSVSILGSHPWDELATERPSEVRASLSRPRGIVRRLTMPDLTARRSDPQIRDTLDRALLRVSDEVVILTMIAALADRTGYVRATAARALAGARDPRAVGPLIVTAGLEERAFVRQELVKALGASALGPSRRRAVVALAEALIDVDVSVRQAAARELERLTGAGLEGDVRAWQRWWKEKAAEFRSS